VAPRRRGSARAPDPPTAIFGFNDNVAIGAQAHANLRVPRTFSIIGFDDTEHAVIDAPPDLGAAAARGDGPHRVSLLMRLIDGQRVDALRMELDEARRPRRGAAALVMRVALIATLVVVQISSGASHRRDAHGRRPAPSIHWCRQLRAPESRRVVGSWGSPQPHRPVVDCKRRATRAPLLATGRAL
jgi:hypothetical protein